MKEAFLYYVWKFRLFNQKKLQSTSRNQLQILSTGEQNHQSGPDFFNAQIKIDQTTWAGNVEIHIYASDWHKHGHQNDPAYNNIILHVVYEADVSICRKNGEPIPTLELKPLIPPALYRNYLYLQSAKAWIPCEKLIHQIQGFTFSAYLHRLLIERLARKTEPILHSLQLNQNSWEETFYQFLAKAFGTKINAAPFELLAKSLPISILAKHKNDLFQIEALLFGQAGLLDVDFEEDYPNALKKEYHFLRKKFNLQALQGHSWKTTRLRPPNFPSIRIAQLAALIHQSIQLFSKIIVLDELKAYYDLFTVNISPYWHTHYVFDKKSSKRKKNIGKTLVHNLIINTIAPILFVYGKERGKPELQEKALNLLEKVPAEENSVLTQWAYLGRSAKSAFDSQALLELKNEYCSKKRCLECVVGHELVRKEDSLMARRG